MSTFGSFDEFWAVLSRWYDRQLKRGEQIRELQAMIREHAPQIRQTSEQMQQTDARLDRLSFHGSNIGWNCRQNI